MPIVKKPYDSEVVQKFIQYGLTYAELNELFSKEFFPECYSGCEIFHHCMPKKVVIKLMPTARDAVPVSKARIRQIQSLVAIRLNVDPTEVLVFIELVKKKGLCPQIHATQIAQKLAMNFPLHRAVYSSLKSIREENTQGCQIIVSGKTKGQRAKTHKFSDGVILYTGQPAKEFTRTGFASVKLRQGILGIKVNIVLNRDPEGINGPSKEMPDKIIIFDPKDE